MLFAVDIGNTNIKTALFENEELVKKIIFTSIDDVIHYAEENEHSDAAVSSVVPEKLKRFMSSYTSSFQKNPFVIDNNLSFNLTIDYKTPETLGIDRICSSEGAFALYKNSQDYASYDGSTYILAIDFGTATTVNFISYNCVFMGGMIMPGLKMMFESLKKGTAQLPLVSNKEFESQVGKSTKASIASGVLNAQAGTVDRAVDFIKQLTEFPVIKIYITGGVAEDIIPFINHIFYYEPNLVLYGINRIFFKNKHYSRRKGTTIRQ